MRLKGIVIILIFLLLSINFLSLLQTNSNLRADTPPTFYVGSGEEYTTIFSAINAAWNMTNQTGLRCRVIVLNGTYYESLTIPIKLDLFGEDKGNTIIDGNDATDVIRINASYVNISHFTIIDSGSGAFNSLIKINSDSAIITDNVLHSGFLGIFINNSDGHIIYDNTIRDNSGDGIYLNNSDSNTNISYNSILRNRNGIYFYLSQLNYIYNNSIKSNSDNGIFLNKSCHQTTVKRNNVTDNSGNGIFLNDYSNLSTISQNAIYYNDESGIALENCSLTTINNYNTIYGNGDYGIIIVGSDNTITYCTIQHNRDGIFCNADDNTTITNSNISANALVGLRMYNSTSDTIHTNQITANNQYGTYLDYFTKLNQIYNNFFRNNAVNAQDKSISTYVKNTLK